MSCHRRKARSFVEKVVHKLTCWACRFPYWFPPDFLNDAMVPTGALQLFVIWEVINSIEEFHEHLVHGRILSLILLGDTSDTRGFFGMFFWKVKSLMKQGHRLKGNMLLYDCEGSLDFNGFKQQWVSDLRLESWCCKPFGGIIDWTAAFVLIKHVGQQNPGENGSIIICPVLSRANGFRLPAISSSGHCLNFRSKCNSTSLLNKCQSLAWKAPKTAAVTSEKIHINKL